MAQRNKQRGKARAAYAAAAGFSDNFDSYADAAAGAGGSVIRGSGAAVVRRGDDWMEHVEELREYDVPYHHRIAIDTGRRVGLWCVLALLACPLFRGIEYAQRVRMRLWNLL